MRGTRHVLATIAAAAVIQPAVLAQGTSPWVDAVANLSTAFTGPITLPGGKISQERPQAERHECVNRAGPIAPKLPILRGSLLARSP